MLENVAASVHAFAANQEMRCIFDQSWTFVANKEIVLAVIGVLHAAM